MAQSSDFYKPKTVDSWEEHPDYQTACRVNYEAGDNLAYTPAHAGSTAEDFTSFKFGLSRWSETSLPDIMYQIWPCKAWEEFKNTDRPEPVRDAQGRPMKELYPREDMPARVLLDYPIFKEITHIATNTPTWLLELWARLEPRLRWEDIHMRMKNIGQKKLLDFDGFKNSRFNNKTRVYRLENQMISWRNKVHGSDIKGNLNKTYHTVVDGLCPAQVRANSTLSSLSSIPPTTTGSSVTMPSSAPTGANTESRRSAEQSNPKKRKSSTQMDDEASGEGTKKAKKICATTLLQTGYVTKTASSRGTKRSLDADENEASTKKVRLSKDEEPNDSPPIASSKQSLPATSNAQPKHVLKVQEHRLRRVAPRATSSALLSQPNPSSAENSTLSLHYNFDARTNSFWANHLMQGACGEPAEQATAADSQVEFGIDLNECLQAELTPPVWQPFCSDPTSWSSEWKTFIVDHDAEPILKAHAWDDL